MPCIRACLLQSLLLLSARQTRRRKSKRKPKLSIKRLMLFLVSCAVRLPVGRRSAER